MENIPSIETPSNTTSAKSTINMTNTTPREKKDQVFQEQVVKCEFKSHLFDGFQTEIEISKVEDLEELVMLAVSMLFHVLKAHNMNGLITHLDMLKFKVYEFTLEEIKNNKIGRITISEIDSD